MTNGERYKTSQERAEAFRKFCKESKDIESVNCTFTSCDICQFFWLDLEAEEEKSLPCPFCGRKTKRTKNFEGVHFIMCDCGYLSAGNSDKESAIVAHNRVAKAVMDAKEGGEK